MVKKICGLMKELKFKVFNKNKIYLFVCHILYGKNIQKGRRVSWMKYPDFGFILNVENGYVIICFWDSRTNTYIVEKVAAVNIIYQNHVHTYDKTPNY